MTIFVLPKFRKTDLRSFDVTSSGGPLRMLSPFVLGPVPLYPGVQREAKNVENAWQYSKVYAEHTDPESGDPTDEYWAWAAMGWSNAHAVRYPMGKGAIPLYSMWDFQHLGYIEARKRIYIPLYSGGVRRYAQSSLRLLRQAASQGDIAIKDYDAYDHRALGYSWDDVVNDPRRKMGHGFVLAMVLEGVI